MTVPNRQRGEKRMFQPKPSDQVQLQATLRRICDLTSPNLPRLDESRSEGRQNRIIPVLLTPWEDGIATVEETTTALTKDLSDSGLSLTLPGPFRVQEIALGFWVPDDEFASHAFFLLGHTRESVPIGGGFWGLGVETVRQLKHAEVEELIPLVEKRLPPSKLELEPPSALIGE